MRHRTLKEAQQALADALRDLEATRMTRHDDPVLTELKADIRRSIPTEGEDGLSTAA
jgi:hypothetical protein